MTKALCPISVHGVIERAYEELGGKASVLSVLTHRTLNWLHTSLNPDREERQKARLTFEDAQALTDAGALALAHDLARRAGMQLVPLTGPASDQFDLMASTADMLGRTGEAAQAVSLAMADGVLDADEKREIKKRALAVADAAVSVIKAAKGFGAP